MFGRKRDLIELVGKRASHMNGLERIARSFLLQKASDDSIYKVAMRIKEAREVRFVYTGKQRKERKKRTILLWLAGGLTVLAGASAYFLYKRDHPKTFTGKIKRVWRNRSGKEDRKSAMFEFLLQGGYTVGIEAISEEQVTSMQKSVDMHIKSINHSKEDIKNNLYPAIIYLVNSMRRIGRSYISRYRLEHLIELPHPSFFLKDVMTYFIKKQENIFSLPALRLNRWALAEATMRSAIEIGKFNIIENSLALMDNFFCENVALLELIVRNLKEIKDKSAYLDDKHLAFIAKQMQLCTYFTNKEIYKEVRRIRRAKTEEHLEDLIKAVNVNIPAIYKSAVEVIEFEKEMTLIIDERTKNAVSRSQS